jgi:membrane protein DedA with SNARE-associated domain
MWWQYVLVFFGALLFDIVPFPFLPAFTIMIFLQIYFDLNVWIVLVIGVAGSILGRFLMSLYVPYLSEKYFRPAKNADIKYLGKKMKEKGWKGQAAVLAYSLLPLPTTPLFVAAGISKVGALYIIPAFFIGKFTSDAIALLTGKYASENIDKITEDLYSWQSILGLVLSLIMLLALLFIDWRALLQNKHFQLKFKILK